MPDKGTDCSYSAHRVVSPKGQAPFRIREDVHRRFNRTATITSTDAAGSPVSHKVKISLKLGAPPAADEPFVFPLSARQLAMVGAGAAEIGNAMLDAIFGKLLIYSRHQAGDAVWSAMRRLQGPTGSTVGGPAMTVLLGVGLPALLAGMPRNSARTKFAKALGWITECLGNVNASTDPDDLTDLVFAANKVKDLKAKITQLSPTASTAGSKRVLAARLVGLDGFDAEKHVGETDTWRTACQQFVVEAWHPPKLKMVHLAVGLANEDTAFRHRLGPFLSRLRPSQSEVPAELVPIVVRFQGLLGPSDDISVRVSADGFCIMHLAQPGAPSEAFDAWLQDNPWARGLADGPQMVVVEVKTRSTPATIRKISQVVSDNGGTRLFVLDLDKVADRLRWRKLVNPRALRAQICMLGAATDTTLCLSVESTPFDITYAVLTHLGDRGIDAFLTVILNVFRDEVVGPMTKMLVSNVPPSKSKVMHALGVTPPPGVTEAGLKYDHLRNRALLRAIRNNNGPFGFVVSAKVEANDEWDVNMGGGDRWQQGYNKADEAPSTCKLQAALVRHRIGVHWTSFASCAGWLLAWLALEEDETLADRFDSIKGMRNCRDRHLSLHRDAGPVALAELGRLGRNLAAFPLDSLPGDGTGIGDATGGVDIQGDAVGLNGNSTKSVDWDSGELAAARSAGADGGHAEVTLTPTDWVFTGRGNKAVVAGESKSTRKGAFKRFPCQCPDCCTFCRCADGATHPDVARRPAAARTGCAECGKALAAQFGIGVPNGVRIVLVLCNQNRFVIDGAPVSCFERHHRIGAGG